MPEPTVVEADLPPPPPPPGPPAAEAQAAPVAAEPSMLPPVADTGPQPERSEPPPMFPDPPPRADSPANSDSALSELPRQPEADLASTPSDINLPHGDDLRREEPEQREPEQPRPEPRAQDDDGGMIRDYGKAPIEAIDETQAVPGYEGFANGTSDYNAMMKAQRDAAMENPVLTGAGSDGGMEGSPDVSPDAATGPVDTVDPFSEPDQATAGDAASATVLPSGGDGLGPTSQPDVVEPGSVAGPEDPGDGGIENAVGLEAGETGGTSSIDQAPVSGPDLEPVETPSAPEGALTKGDGEPVVPTTPETELSETGLPETGLNIDSGDGPPGAPESTGEMASSSDLAPETGAETDEPLVETPVQDNADAALAPTVAEPSAWVDAGEAPPVAVEPDVEGPETKGEAAPTVETPTEIDEPVAPMPDTTPTTETDAGATNEAEVETPAAPTTEPAGSNETDVPFTEDLEGAGVAETEGMAEAAPTSPVAESEDAAPVVPSSDKLKSSEEEPTGPTIEDQEAAPALPDTEEATEPPTKPVESEQETEEAVPPSNPELSEEIAENRAAPVQSEAETEEPVAPSDLEATEGTDHEEAVPVVPPTETDATAQTQDTLVNVNAETEEGAKETDADATDGGDGDAAKTVPPGEGTETETETETTEKSESEAETQAAHETGTTTRSEVDPETTNDREATMETDAETDSERDPEAAGEKDQATEKGPDTTSGGETDPEKIDRDGDGTPDKDELEDVAEETQTAADAANQARTEELEEKTAEIDDKLDGVNDETREDLKEDLKKQTEAIAEAQQDQLDKAAETTRTEAEKQADLDDQAEKDRVDKDTRDKADQAVADAKADADAKAAKLEKDTADRVKNADEKARADRDDAEQADQKQRQEELRLAKQKEQDDLQKLQTEQAAKQQEQIDSEAKRAQAALAVQTAQQSAAAEADTARQQTEAAARKAETDAKYERRADDALGEALDNVNKNIAQDTADAIVDDARIGVGTMSGDFAGLAATGAAAALAGRAAQRSVQSEAARLQVAEQAAAATDGTRGEQASARSASPTATVPRATPVTNDAGNGSQASAAANTPAASTLYVHPDKDRLEAMDRGDAIGVVIGGDDEGLRMGKSAPIPSGDGAARAGDEDEPKPSADGANARPPRRPLDPDRVDAPAVPDRPDAHLVREGPPTHTQERHADRIAALKQGAPIDADLDFLLQFSKRRNGTTDGRLEEQFANLAIQHATDLIGSPLQNLSNNGPDYFAVLEDTIIVGEFKSTRNEVGKARPPYKTDPRAFLEDRMPGGKHDIAKRETSPEMLAKQAELAKLLKETKVGPNGEVTWKYKVEGLHVRVGLKDRKLGGKGGYQIKFEDWAARHTPSRSKNSYNLN